MTIGKKKRNTNGPSPWHRAKTINTISKMKVAIRATVGFGLPATLRTLSDATALFFGEDERVTSKGMLGNDIARRLYFRYTTSTPRKNSRIKQVGSRATRRKSAADLRDENEELKRKIEASEAGRRAQVARERSAALGRATDEARDRRRTAAPYTPPSVIDADASKLKRVRGPRSRG